MSQHCKLPSGLRSDMLADPLRRFHPDWEESWQPSPDHQHLEAGARRAGLALTSTACCHLSGRGDQRKPFSRYGAARATPTQPASPDLRAPSCSIGPT